VLLALAGLIAGWFFWIRPDSEPVLLAIPVVQYDPPDWPPNPWAEADAHAVRERFGTDSAEAFQFQQKARILGELNRAADDSHGRDKDRPLIVYLSALGTVADGKVYLVPGDSKPDDPTTWISLDELLAPLRRTSARRLLILDVRPVNAPRAALPAEDVNEALDTALGQLTDKRDLPFLVLTANNPCDGPNVLQPLRRSVFSLAVSQGLAGAADGWGAEGHKDERVMAKELAAYVREVTATVTQSPGLVLQVPRLHGESDDFRLLPVPQGGPPPLPTPADPEKYPPWLIDGWKERDAWVAAGLHRRAPRVTFHLSRVARRAEQRWLGGLDSKAVQAQFAPVAAELRGVANTLAPTTSPTHSVARVRVRVAKEADAAYKELTPLFSAIRNAGPVKPEEAKGGLPPEITAAIAAARGKSKDADPCDATAVALFRFAVVGLENPTHDQMKAIAATAAAFELKHVEFLTVALVAGLSDRQVSRWPDGTTRKLLEITRDAEEAAALDSRALAHPALASQLTAADRLRREFLQTICDLNAREDDVRGAPGKLKGLPEKYAAVRGVGTALADGWGVYEETRAGLADLAVAFPHVLVPDPEAAATDWSGLVEEYRRLEVLLVRDLGRRVDPEAPPEPLPDATTLARTTQAVLSYREALRRRLQVPEGAGPRVIEQALAWPWWTHAERLDLVARLDQAHRATADRALARWPPKSSGQDPLAPAKCSPRVARDSARDCRRMEDLLLIASGPDVPPGKDRLPEAPPADFAQAARRARVGLRQSLSGLYQSEQATAEYQARVGWLVDPEDVPAFPQRRITAPPNPELLVRREVEGAALRGFGGRRYRADATEIAKLDLTRATDAHKKALQQYAAGLDVVAGEYQTWSP
jgi:hypothetical protein